MKKIRILVLALLFATPSLVHADIFSMKLGFFFPTAKSDLWQTEFDQMSFKRSDFRESSLGFSYERFLTKQFSLEISVDMQSKHKAGYYRDFSGITFVDNFGKEYDYAFNLDDIDESDGEFLISHGFNVSTTPVHFSLKIMPLGRRTRIVPYVGGGAGIYFWSAKLRGEIINFEEEKEEIFEYQGREIIGHPVESANFKEGTHIAIGYHAFAGLMIPIGNRMTISGEFRYSIAKGEMKDSFIGFEDFDLGGYTLTAGLNYWF